MGDEASVSARLLFFDDLGSGSAWGSAWGSGAAERAGSIFDGSMVWRGDGAGTGTPGTAPQAIEARLRNVIRHSMLHGWDAAATLPIQPQIRMLDCPQLTASSSSMRFAVL